LSYFFLLFVVGAHAQCPLKEYPVTDHSAPVIIIGGGLTGLIAAYELRKAGISSMILEAEDRVGGRVDTIYYRR
jgi:monoamine oxidase